MQPFIIKDVQAAFNWHFAITGDGPARRTVFAGEISVCYVDPIPKPSRN
jgi:hypothetical protein